MNTITVSRSVINQEVAVTSWYFRRGRQLRSFPRRMEFGGREYTFIESGLRYTVRKGAQALEVFDMTDGETDYRLKFDPAQRIWTLVATRQRKPRTFYSNVAE